MSIEKLIKAFELERQILGVGEKKCPLSAIQAAEKELEMVFPPTYRYYLEHIHLNTQTPIFGVELTETGELKETSSVFVTYDLRNYEDLPDEYVLIDQENDFQHVLDTTQINEAGESPVISWHQEHQRIVYPDFDGFYLERVDGEIYSYMYDKAEEQKLKKEEVQAYIQLHGELGFSATEHRFLKKHWEQLQRKAK
ncbi:MAG: SMI1/KNR4 family protein [Candidatus Sericytochromatia bacterium]